MATLPTAFVLDNILSSEELSTMGRRRHQKPSVLRTKAKGRKQWYFRYVLDVIGAGGQIERREQPPKYLGWCDEITKREAEKIRDQFLATINEPQIVIPSQIPMSDIFTRYKAVELPLCKPTTVRNYTYCIDNELMPVFGPLKVYQVDADAVQEWLNTMMDRAPNTRKFKLRVLSSVIEFAARRKWTRERNPCKDVRVGDVGGRRWDLRALTIDEVRRLLMVADARADGTGEVIRIGVFSGLRIGEIRCLRWNDFSTPGAIRVDESVDQENAVSVPKTASGVRYAAAPPMRLVRPLDAKDTDLVFTTEYDTIRWRLDRCLTVAGINVGTGWCTHGLRRTHATLMKQAGARAMAEQLGHATEKMSSVYVRESFDDHAAAVGRMVAMVERVQ